MRSDFRKINNRLVRKPFPIPKISTVLQELDVFTFATSLDLNMRYYTISLDPDASKICPIIFPWGKYSYIRLPMGIAGSPDIFQTKMSEPMAALIVCANLSWWSTLHHEGKPWRPPRTFKGSPNKVARSGFEGWCPKIKILCQRNGISWVHPKNGWYKPQPNKVQAILTLTSPKGVKDLQRFLGMVQYY